MARLLTHILFWILMSCLTAGAIIVVFCLYFPYIAIKAAYMALTGRIRASTPGHRRSNSLA